MCSCLRALKTSLAAESWTFWNLSRRCFAEPDRRELQQSSFDNKGTEEGFCSINSEIVTDVTNSPNFYVGRSADVGDMLLRRKCAL